MVIVILRVTVILLMIGISVESTSVHVLFSTTNKGTYARFNTSSSPLPMIPDCSYVVKIGQ